MRFGVDAHDKLGIPLPSLFFYDSNPPPPTGSISLFVVITLTRSSQGLFPPILHLNFFVFFIFSVPLYMLFVILFALLLFVRFVVLDVS